MNVVFAYHKGDCELAMESAKAITAMGINMRHKAYVCAVSDTPLILEITEELKKSFPEVERIIAQDGFSGWPLGPNQMFDDVASFMYSKNSPFLFWEPDCVPMKKGWLDELDAEYHKKPAILGHKYQGGMASNGKNIYEMIVGSAIYPSNFLDYCPSACSLNTYNMAYRSAGTVPEPWDVRCRWNFMAIGRDCPLLRTYWKSCNYQWKDGKIVFFASDPEAQAIQEVTCPDRTVSTEAIVVHGCKDGSLHRMAQQGFSIPSDSTGLKPLNSMELKQVATNDELKPDLQDNSTQKTIKPIRKKKDKIVAKKTIQPVTVNPQDADDFIKQLRKLASNLKNPEKNTEQSE